ncbi:hypothetical protein BRADI_4g17435v3 [Brachypodium distachyon]|uniref:Uncharacterized protein n=1 Tax=Brachypodium distachyon TaxID=15368 RepID=A0A0Q3ELF1_BRADI|nr:hypothetical protein BRADI_4g17435v3 [Brachypodium distachyon]
MLVTGLDLVDLELKLRSQCHRLVVRGIRSRPTTGFCICFAPLELDGVTDERSSAEMSRMVEVFVRSYFDSLGSTIILIRASEMKFWCYIEAGSDRFSTYEWGIIELSGRTYFASVGYSVPFPTCNLFVFDQSV